MVINQYRFFQENEEKEQKDRNPKEDKEMDKIVEIILQQEMVSSTLQFFSANRGVESSLS